MVYSLFGFTLLFENFSSAFYLKVFKSYFYESIHQIFENKNKEKN